MDLLRRSVTAEPPILWHYTTADGLLGIVQNKHIRMSHIACMNDSEEYRHGLKHLEEAAHSRLSSGLPPDLEKLHRFLIGSLAYPRDIPGIFVACLSEETDALTHWIEYGQQGVGYAIGFDTGKLKAVTQNTTDQVFSPILAQCVYRDHCKRKMLLSWLEKVDEVFSEFVANKASQWLIDVHIGDFVTPVMWAVYFLGPVFKHAIFEPEHEWRMIAFYDGTGLDAPKFIARNNEIREFVKLPIGEGAASAIAEIKIGSNRDERLRKIGVDVITRFLKSEGLEHVKVSESMSPYRSP